MCKAKKLQSEISCFNKNGLTVKLNSVNVTLKSALELENHSTGDFQELKGIEAALCEAEILMNRELAHLECSNESTQEKALKFLKDLPEFFNAMSKTIDKIVLDTEKAQTQTMPNPAQIAWFSGRDSTMQMAG